MTKICVAIPIWHGDKDLGQDFFTHSSRMIVKVPIRLVIIELKSHFCSHADLLLCCWKLKRHMLY